MSTTSRAYLPANQVPNYAKRVMDEASLHNCYASQLGLSLSKT